MNVDQCRPLNINTNKWKTHEIEFRASLFLFLRIQEFQREKQERDDKIAEEQRLKKLKKEQEKESAALKVQSALNIQVIIFSSYLLPQDRFIDL